MTASEASAPKTRQRLISFFEILMSCLNAAMEDLKVEDVKEQPVVVLKPSISVEEAEHLPLRSLLADYRHLRAMHRDRHVSPMASVDSALHAHLSKRSVEVVHCN